MGMGEGQALQVRRGRPVVLLIVMVHARGGAGINSLLPGSGSD